MWKFCASFYIKRLIFVLTLCAISNTSANNLNSIQCSTLYGHRNFVGNKVDISDEIGWTYKGNLGLIPNSIKVSSNCSLSLFDGVGYIQTINEDIQNFTWIVSVKQPVFLMQNKIFHDISSFFREKIPFIQPVVIVGIAIR